MKFEVLISYQTACVQALCAFCLLPPAFKKDRSPNKIRSGIWLDPCFIDAFIEWNKIHRKQNWEKFLPYNLDTKYIFEAPKNYHYCGYPRTKIAIQESNGYVCNFDEVYNSLKILRKDLLRQNIINVLEGVARKLELDLDYSILEDENLEYDQRIYQCYSKLFQINRFEGEAGIWYHPELMKMITTDKSHLQLINDWERRREKNLTVTQISAPNLSYHRDESNLSKLRIKDCQIILYDAPDLLCLKASNSKQEWTFYLDLEELTVSIDVDLVNQWKQKLAAYSNRYERRLSEGDICDSDPTSTVTNDPDELLPLVEIDQTIAIAYGIEAVNGKSFVPDSMKNALRKLCTAVEKEFGDLNPREVLGKLGYFSPHYESEESAIAIEDSYRTLSFGDISVRQRESDNFVNANDMYRPFGKRLDNWLKTDQTYEFFKAVAEREQLNCNYLKRGNSDYTRITTSFPDLIERKEGSPATGGGTWISPLIALNLAQSVDAKFAADAVYVLAAYFGNQKQHK